MSAKSVPKSAHNKNWCDPEKSAWKSMRLNDLNMILMAWLYHALSSQK